MSTERFELIAPCHFGLEAVLKREILDLGWFVGYAPAEDPRLAVCVIVEEGGSGGRTAGPIAKKLFDAYLIP